jgi:hypothetical protein
MPPCKSVSFVRKPHPKKTALRRSPALAFLGLVFGAKAPVFMFIIGNNLRTRRIYWLTARLNSRKKGLAGCLETEQNIASFKGGLWSKKR